MAVQVLIENAVKHNEISDRKPLTIHIVTNNEGYLSVSNDIQPKRTAASGTGIGLVCFIKTKIVFYSYLIASIGSKSAAFFAGYQPKKTPVTVQTAKERKTLHG